MKNSHVFKCILIWQNSNRMYSKYILMYLPTLFPSWFVPSSIICSFCVLVPDCLLLDHPVWLLNYYINTEILPGILVLSIYFTSSNISYDSINNFCVTAAGDVHSNCIFSHFLPSTLNNFISMTWNLLYSCFVSICVSPLTF